MRRPPLENPRLAEAFDGLRNDYNAAKANRFRRRRTGISAMGSGADYHYRVEGDFLRVMEYARDMDRNDCIVGQTIDRAVTNLVQDGISCDPQTGDRELDKDLRARWCDWCEDPEQCDLAGERTFWEIEQLIPRQCFVDGDICVLPNRSGALELVEAHRLRTPAGTKKNVVHGVLLDPATRRRLQYWFTREDVDPMALVKLVGDVVPIDARDAQGLKQVFHVLVGKRASQTRGVSALSPIFDLCGMFEDINFAKLVQQQIVSCFAIFRQRDLEFAAGVPAAQGERSTDTLRDGGSKNIEGISPGMQIVGEPGEQLQGFSPQVPNPEYFDHVRLILTLIGINLGMPLVMVLMDASETNFSGWRGAIDQARLGFRQNQRRLVNRFHKPVYLWKVRQWLAEDAALRTMLQQGVDVFAHRFNAPTWPYIQPLQDASADLLRTRNALISHRRRCAERGLDWDDLSTEIVEDNAELIEKAFAKAVELNQKYPDLAITWREIASLPTPDGVQISLNAGEQTADPQPGE